MYESQSFKLLCEIKSKTLQCPLFNAGMWNFILPGFGNKMELKLKTTKK